MSPKDRVLFFSLGYFFGSTGAGIVIQVLKLMEVLP